MNILMLDIDGVLKDSNREGISTLGGSCLYPVEFTKESFNINPICLGLIRQIVEKYELKIVISSAWRCYSCLEHFHQMFDLYGWDTRDILLGFTPVTCNGIRGEDIAAWLKDHSEIEDIHYLILDDNDDFLSEQMQYLVKTDYRTGICVSDLEKIETIMESCNVGRNRSNPAGTH